MERPRVVHVNGALVDVEAHDTYHLAERSKIRKQLADAHPDRGGSRTNFEKIHRKYVRWQTVEMAWYRRVGLTPPAPGANTVDYEIKKRQLLLAEPVLAKGVAFGRYATQRVAELMRDAQWRTQREVMDTLQITRHQMSATVARLRKRGAMFEYRKAHRRNHEFRLVNYSEITLPHGSKIPAKVVAALKEGPVEITEFAVTHGTTYNSVSRAVYLLRKRGLSLAVRDGMIVESQDKQEIA